jgi:hypothetical protein
MNRIVPPGVREPVEPLTEAVRVTVWPKGAGLSEDDKVAVVAMQVTTCVREALLADEPVVVL